jgi:hypothetical protein
VKEGEIKQGVKWQVGPANKKIENNGEKMIFMETFWWQWIQ